MYLREMMKDYKNEVKGRTSTVNDIKGYSRKIPGRGRRQAIYFSMGGWCGKFSNYIGHWCPTKSNYMGGWYFAAWKGKKENYLPKKGRSFIKSSQKKVWSLANGSGNGHFCLYTIVKTRMFPLKIGKNRYPNKLPNSGFCSGNYFTRETCIFRRIYSRKQRYRVVRLLAKANTCKTCTNKD